MYLIHRLAVTSFAAAALSLGVAGCLPEHPDVIPSSAQLTVSGRTLHYIAANDGMVYAYDKPTQRLLWSGRVLRGQSVDIDPQKNQITLGGSVVANKLLYANNDVDLYFDPSPLPAAQNQSSNNGPGYNTNVTITPNSTAQPNGTTGTTVTVQPGVPATQPAPNP